VAVLPVFSRAPSNPLVQIVTMLVSMGLVFYASHPLGRYLARAYGVGAEYFFLGTVATELMFSTKVGDLGEMRREFEKQVPGSAAVVGQSP
jgi:hypothetical protein